MPFSSQRVCVLININPSRPCLSTGYWRDHEGHDLLRGYRQSLHEPLWNRPDGLAVTSRSHAWQPAAQGRADSWARERTSKKGQTKGGIGMGVARTAANLAGTKVKEPGRLEVQQQFRGKLNSLNVFTPNGKLLQIEVGDFALNGNASKNQRSNYHLITRSVQGGLCSSRERAGFPASNARGNRPMHPD